MVSKVVPWRWPDGTKSTADVRDGFKLSIKIGSDSNVSDETGADHSGTNR
jgi:hypothetical protein